MSGEDGAASIYVLMSVMILTAVSVAVTAVATGQAAHRMAVKAADLSALAGAQRSLVDLDAACTAAEQIADANGARMSECGFHDGSLMVEVRVPLRWSFLPEVGASARAGYGTPLG